MGMFFELINLIISRSLRGYVPLPLINGRLVVNRRNWMQHEYNSKGGPNGKWSPDTSTVTIPTQALLNFLKQFTSENYVFGDSFDFQR